MHKKLPKLNKRLTHIGGGSSNIAREGDGYAIPNGDGITNGDLMTAGI